MAVVNTIPAPTPVSDDAIADRRVVVMGLGRFGGGVGVTRFLAERGARVLVTDLADADTLRHSLDQLDDLPIEFRLGQHDPHDLHDADLLVVSPAVDCRNNPFVREAFARGIPWTTEINLFLCRCRAPLIGVTGSVGKSTTCAMLHAILSHAIENGQTAFRRALLGGNIGASLLNVIGDLSESDVVVLELSSFQLEWALSDFLRPLVAVITNVTPHHLNRHQTFDAYLGAKVNLLRGMSPGSLVILGSTDEPLYSAAEKICDERSLRLRTMAAPDNDYELRLPGQHNQHNAAVAVAVATELGANESDCSDALSQFSPLPHRLELVGESGGVQYFNDSKATSASALMTAIRSFCKPVLLLCGGSAVAEEIEAIARMNVEGVRAIACFGQAGATLAEKLTPRLDENRVRQFDDLEAAAEWACANARPDEVVVLSPGLPSYDAYANYEARGKAFADIVAANIR